MKIATNRKALGDYQIMESYEAGIALKGSEVKSLRERGVSLQDSFCKIEDGEILLYHMHINPYAKSSVFAPDPVRVRKLLLHKNEINRLYGKLTGGNLTIVPLELFFNAKGLAKVKIAVVKKHKAPDKREIIKKRDTEMEMRREKMSRQ